MNPGKNNKSGVVKWFREVIVLPLLPDNNPAIVNVQTKLLRLSKEYLDKLPDIWKIYILYHELGHVNAGVSEEAAESWAIKHFIEHGYSVKEVINAHTEVFPWDKLSPEVAEGLLIKTQRALELAKLHDFHVNGNISLFKKHIR